MSDYKNELIRIARKEIDDFGRFAEGTIELEDRIRHYARALKIAIPRELRDYHWSALFTSYCIKAAGANADEFAFSARHATYVHQSIRNAMLDAGCFRGRDPSIYAPKEGDLVCMNQPGGVVTFEQAARDADYGSHSVIVVADTGATLKAARGNNPSGQHDYVEFVKRNDGAVAPLEPNAPLICVIEVTK